MIVEFDNIKVNISNPEIYGKIQRIIFKIMGTKAPSNKNPYKSWQTDEIELLIELYNSGKTLKEICEQLGRSKSSVSMYIGRLQRKWGSLTTYTGSKKINGNQEKPAQAKQEFVI